MIKKILIYESNHFQKLFPLSRFRAAWDLPSGIYTLRQLLGRLFPEAEIHFLSLPLREYLLDNPLSGSAMEDHFAGAASKAGRLFTNETNLREKNGQILIVHAHFTNREILFKLALKQDQDLRIDMDGVPLLACLPPKGSWTQEEWWQDILNGQDPLPSKELPEEFCLRYPWDLLDSLPENLEIDKQLLSNDLFTHRAMPQIYGRRQNVFLHKSAEISPGVVLDARDGSIVIDKKAQINGPSIISGPIYIGPYSSIDGAKLRGDSYIGYTCKIAGEIEKSIILDFSNKHHDGFMGHTVVGSWANWGSLANTSDLKNNYGDIRIWNLGEQVNSGKIKLGTICGDFVKIAIGMQINTGTVLDVAANVFGPALVPKYAPGFLWGTEKINEGYDADFYDIKRFLSDSEKIMARRKQQLHPELKKQLQENFKAITGKNSIFP